MAKIGPMFSDRSTNPGPLPSPRSPEGPPEELLGRVYAQLRALAQQQMNSERAGHTLSATALVHEAYLRLAGPREGGWETDAQFYVAAAHAMRRILIDHARARVADRRGGPAARRAALQLTELPDTQSDEDAAGFLILNDAIARLESADAHAASVVRLRYFGGLSVGETARVLGVSEPTIKRTWAFARAWLKEMIEREA